MTDGVLDAAEVRRQLQARRRDSGEDFQQLLERYAVDRFLYRLGLSEHRTALILKGAVLFSAWLDVPHRPTRDVDFAFARSPTQSDLDLVASLVADICNVGVPEDGVVYDADSIVVDEIREGASYFGARATLRASIGTARIRVKIDIGFGDAVTPDPHQETMPALLDQPDAVVLAYPRETVVAEKLEIIVQLGLVNSRMKDYFDLQSLAANFDFDGEVLVDAIRNTFERRSTALPATLPMGLSDGFAADATKVEQWNAFLGRIERRGDGSLAECVAKIRQFAVPVLDACVDPARIPAIGTWNPERGWT